jgi:hypothetical protein
MAYGFVTANSQYLSVASAPAAAAPLTMACWFNPANDTTRLALLSIEDSTGAHRFELRAWGNVTGKPLRFGCAAGGSDAQADTTTGFVANQWQHACAVAASATSRTVYLDAGSSGTNTVSRTPVVDRLKVGVFTFSSTLVNYFSGSIAEVGIWNAALTAAEVESLAKGMTCDKVRPESLVFYAPLVRDLQDLSGGLTITNNNAATVDTHPRVYA